MYSFVPSISLGIFTNFGLTVSKYHMGNGLPRDTLWMRVSVSSSQSLDKILSIFISLSPVSGSVKKSVGIVGGALVKNYA